MEKGNVKEPPYLSPQVEAVNSVKHDYSAQDVADAFLKQYYNILQADPKKAHKFYHDQSIRAHPSADGSMKSVTTMKGIDDEIMACKVKEWNPDLSTVHAQDSVMQSVIVGVTGCLTDNDDVARNFAQTFLLARQEGGGFYVHNDFLHFIDDAAAASSYLLVNDTAKDSSSKPPVGPINDQNVKSTSEKEDDNIGNKVADSSSNGKNTTLVAEPKKKSQPSVWLPVKNTQSNPKKISYASIVAKEGSVASSTVQASSDAVVIPKPSVLGVPKPSVKPASVSVNDIPENSDIKAIRVKDLPPKMNEESLLEYVKQFGPVNKKNIQIKEYYEDGYRYAFVEFDNAKAAHSAVEARYIQFEDRESEIQYKRSSSQGPRFRGNLQNGRGGFRNWGRDGNARNSSSFGQRYGEHESGGRYYGQNRDFDYNNNRRNRNYHDQPRSFN